MAFVLTPHFAPAYQAHQCNPFGFHAPVLRYPQTYHVARPRTKCPSYSTFNRFFSQVDEMISAIRYESQHQEGIEVLEVRCEAQSQAHRQRQQRKRALRANFAVNRTEQGWQVNGEIQDIDQVNINVEMPDEYTLKVSGNTQWQAEGMLVRGLPQSASEDTSGIGRHSTENDHRENLEVNVARSESPMTAKSVNTGATTPGSDTQSHRSYQATVEDDFEDLGAKVSSLVPASSPSSPSEVTEPQTKGKVVDDTTVSTQPRAEAPSLQVDPHREQRVHGSFERTFCFSERIDTANVSARLEDGVLNISVPRAQVQVRRIAIL